MPRRKYPKKVLEYATIQQGIFNLIDANEIHQNFLEILFKLYIKNDELPDFNQKYEFLANEFIEVAANLPNADERFLRFTKAKQKLEKAEELSETLANQLKDCSCKIEVPVAKTEDEKAVESLNIEIEQVPDESTLISDLIDNAIKNIETKAESCDFEMLLQNSVDVIPSAVKHPNDVGIKDRSIENEVKETKNIDESPAKTDESFEKEIMNLDFNELIQNNDDKENLNPPEITLQNLPKITNKLEVEISEKNRIESIDESDNDSQPSLVIEESPNIETKMENMFKSPIRDDVEPVKKTLEFST